MEPWEVALTYLDTPFGHRGRTRNQLDCVGLLVRTGRDFGLKVHDLRIYGRVPHDEALRQLLVANCGQPVDRPPQVNDILLLQLPHAPTPSHVALVTPYPGDDDNNNNNTLGMIHTYGSLGKVVRHRLNATWEQRISEVFQWPDEVMA